MVGDIHCSTADNNGLFFAYRPERRLYPREYLGNRKIQKGFRHIHSIRGGGYAYNPCFSLPDGVFYDKAEYFLTAYAFYDRYDTDVDELPYTHLFMDNDTREYGTYKHLSLKAGAWSSAAYKHAGRGYTRYGVRFHTVYDTSALLGYVKAGQIAA